MNHFDTAESYGIGSSNEILLGEAFQGRRDQVTIATKFGPLRDPKTGALIGLDGSRTNCRRAIEDSLKRLKTDHIDLYYLHRVDPATPIEETVSAMAELVKEGKIGAIGLSEASAKTISKASKVHPISAVQSEYSLFSRDIAQSRSVQPAQIALAWVMQKNDIILPIAGTTRLENLKINLQALDLNLTEIEISRLDNLADQVHGQRYNDRGMGLLNG